MSDLRKMYIQMLRLLMDSEKQLGFDESLTEKDRVVLLYISQLPQEDDGPVRVNYAHFCEYLSQEGAVTSRTQFFTSVKKLEQLGFMKKVGGPRSSSYLVQ